MKIAIYCGKCPDKAFTEVEFHHGGSGFRSEVSYRVIHSDENGKRQELTRRDMSKSELRSLAYALLALIEG